MWGDEISNVRSTAFPVTPPGLSRPQKASRYHPELEPVPPWPPGPKSSLLLVPCFDRFGNPKVGPHMFGNQT